MNNVDKQYLDLMKDIIDNGTWKNTRSGRVKSVFGRSMRFNLKEGFPLLTTKKMFTKGIIHELLWFLKGDTNIKYLVDNNVHIWDDDAYRWFKTLDFKHLEREESWIDDEEGGDNKEHINVYGYYKLEHRVFDLDEDIDVAYAITINDDYENEVSVSEEEIKNITKEQFVDYVKQGAWIHRYDFHCGRSVSDVCVYKFGDLGEIYGKQWRSFGVSNKDQIQHIIDTLKTNPDDRRMVLTAWNPDVIDNIALPACHMFAQFYTRELSDNERISLWLKKHKLIENAFEQGNLNSEEYKLFKDYWFYDKEDSKQKLLEKVNNENLPMRELNCSFTMRSNDIFLGCPYNCASYAILTHLIAQVCGMTVGDLIYYGLDCHIYENHINAINEQLTHNPFKYKSPILSLNIEITNINDFTFEDIKILNYEAYPSIKAPLSVG